MYEVRKTGGSWAALRRVARGLVPAALGLAAAPAAAQSQAQASHDPALSLATFDSAWTAIHRTHFDTAFNGVDWDALRAELRPRAAAAGTPDELRAVVQEMLGRLEQSHFYLIPSDVRSTLTAEAEALPGSEAEGEAEGDVPPAAEEVVEDDAEAGPGDAGMQVRRVDGRFVVTRVTPGGAAEAAGIRTGWIVEAVDGRVAEEVLSALRSLEGSADPRALEAVGVGVFTSALGGPAGSTARVRLVGGDGRPVTLDLVRAVSTATRTKFGNLPEMPVTLERERVKLPDGTTVGVIRFDVWMPAISRAFDQAVDELRDADGIVLDLRGNPGGVGAMAMGISGHFIDEALSLGTMSTRGDVLRFVVNPRRVDTRGRLVKPYAGPVAILTDALSASTSEVFAGGMQGLGRARVFGETTAGQALPAYMSRLPNGDVLVHAFASFTGPRGEPMEGKGVVPDEAAPPTRAELLAGRDPALEAAKRWISQQKRSGAAARRTGPDHLTRSEG